MAMSEHNNYVSRMLIWLVFAGMAAVTSWQNATEVNLLNAIAFGLVATWCVSNMLDNAHKLGFSFTDMWVRIRSLWKSGLSLSFTIVTGYVAWRLLHIGHEELAVWVFILTIIGAWGTLRFIVEPEN